MTGPRSAVLRARGRTRARVLGCAFGAPSSDVRSQSRRLRAWHRPSVRCHPESPFGSDAPSDDDPTAPIVRFVPPTFTTKELSKRTWPDYARFFSQGNGWDHCGCTFMQGFRAPKHLRKWADQRDWNLEVKRGSSRTSALIASSSRPDASPLDGVSSVPPMSCRSSRPGFGGGCSPTARNDSGRSRASAPIPISQQGVTGVALRAALGSHGKEGRRCR